MFSGESIITMANGTFKPITSILKGDMILNKFKVPTKVLKIEVYENESCVRMQLNNGTTSFNISTGTILFCYYRTQASTLVSKYCAISTIHENNGHLKSDLKIFSPDSDVDIDTYENAEPTTLYELHTSDNSQSYLVNKVIVSNIPSHY